MTAIEFAVELAGEFAGESSEAREKCDRIIASLTDRPAGALNNKKMQQDAGRTS